jgi:hypothetical protein
MKKVLLLSLLAIVSVLCYGQSILPLRADTVLIEKTGGSGELKVRNSTRDTLGIFVNIGGGKTKFMRVRQITDTSFVIPNGAGGDTIFIRGISGSGSAARFGIEDALGIQDRYINMRDFAFEIDSAVYIGLTGSAGGFRSGLVLANAALLRSGNLANDTGTSILVTQNAVDISTNNTLIPAKVRISGIGTYAPSSITRVMVVDNDTLKSAPLSAFNTTPPGSDQQIIFNDAGAYGADAGAVYNKTQNKITADSLAALRGRFDAGVKVGTNSSTSTALMQVGTGTPFTTTPYLAQGPLLSNGIYSTLHTSDTLTVANEATIPVRAYQMNRNTVVGANGNVNLTAKNGAALVDLVRVRDTLTMNADGHNNWYANNSQLNFVKAGGYTGRSSIRGGVDGLSDAPNAFTAELVIAGSVGSNNYHFYGDWVSLVGELAHGASSQDTIDHYMSVWANSNYLGRIQRAEYFRGYGLAVSTDTLHSLYFDEPSALGYHEGNFGIGKAMPTRKLDVTGTGLFSDSVGIGTLSPLSKLDVTGSAVASSATSTTALGSTSGANIEAYASAIPTAADQRLGGFMFGSRNGTGASNLTAGLRAYSNGTWTDNVSEQTYVTMSTSATNALLEVMRWTANGRVSIGGTSNPTASLHLKAGAAAAGNAPLKFPSGTNLTTAEAGAMEYDGTSLFFSPSTTRLRTVLTDNSIPGNGQIAVGNSVNYTNADIFPLVSVSTTGTTTLAATAKMTTIKADATGGAVVITLTANHIGQIVNVKKMDSSINTVTVQASSGNIDGGTKVISLQYAAEAFQWDGTNWLILP